LLSPRASSPDHGDVGTPASFTLGNGLQVVVNPRSHARPWLPDELVKVGSADETPGKSGLAHFLEALMFKGTSNASRGRFSQTVLRIGGNENALLRSTTPAFPARAARAARHMMEFEPTGMTASQDENVLPERESCSRNSICGSPIS